MYFIAPILSKIVISLTALATFVVGVPVVECRCPDGHIKHFCFSSPCSTSKCCCRDSSSEQENCCCAAEKAETASSSAASHSCCARAKSTAAQTTQTNLAKVGASGCVKTVMVDAASYSSEQVRILSVSIETAAFQPALELSETLGTSQVHLVNRDLRPPRSPPDLVILLCHFVI